MVGRSAKGVKHRHHNQGDAHDQKGIFSRVLAGFLSPEPFEDGQHFTFCAEQCGDTCALRKSTGHKVSREPAAFKTSGGSRAYLGRRRRIQRC